MHIKIMVKNLVWNTQRNSIHPVFGVFVQIFNIRKFVKKKIHLSHGSGIGSFFWGIRFPSEYFQETVSPKKRIHIEW
jgi:hypothetical protein